MAIPHRKVNIGVNIGVNIMRPISATGQTGGFSLK
jgi:hypothetical protein